MAAPPLPAASDRPLAKAKIVSGLTRLQSGLDREAETNDGAVRSDQGQSMTAPSVGSVTAVSAEAAGRRVGHAER